MIRPSYVTPESTFRCIYPLLKYIVKKTVEVVGFTLFFFGLSLLNHLALIPILLLFQGVAAIHSLMHQRNSLLKRLEVA